MKNLSLIFIILISISFNLYAGISNTVTLSTETNQFQQLVFGLDEQATNGIDINLGEINAPRILPPDPTVFLAAFVIFDSVMLQEPVWSYKDFRPIQEVSHYFVQYSIYVHRGDGKILYFNWEQLPSIIDSATITDTYSDLNLVDFNMKKSKKDSVTNEFIDEFYINVWYNNPNAVVVNNIEDEENISIYPNPFIQNLFLQSGNGNEYNFKIYSQIGELIFDGKSFNGKSALSLISLNNGIYFVYITFNDGRTVVKKLIKL